MIHIRILKMIVYGLDLAIEIVDKYFFVLKLLS